MRLLDLIQQDKAVGLGANRLCEFPSLAEAYIARRRPNKAGDGEALGEFAHVDTYHGVFTTEELLGKCLC